MRVGAGKTLTVRSELAVEHSSMTLTFNLGARHEPRAERCQ